MSILKKTTAADCGRIERPMLTPHLEFRDIGDGRMLLVSESFNTLLGGQEHADLLPLLDGRRSRADIIAALAGTHSESAVKSQLASLAFRGYVVSGDHTMERGSAVFWSSLGATPRWVEERLRTSTVAIHGDDGCLARRLETIGVTVAEESPAVSVVVCDDYLDPGHAGINQRHLSSGAPWMLVRPKGVQPLFGPVFRPAEEGPCWACLSYRLRGHQEIHNFLRNLAGDAAAFRPSAAEPAILDTVYGFVAMEIVKWLVIEEGAPLYRHALSVDLNQMKSEHHPVMRRPQCLACGDPTLYRTDRAAVPVRLRPSPKGIRNSGGVRSVSPQETLARYRHLIGPVSGIVTWLNRTTEDADPWLHVHWSGSNIALRTRTLSLLRLSLRTKSAGKGSTPIQSEASALCEAIERYSGAFHGEEIRHRGRFADFVEAGTSQAIHPNDVQLFSERQLDHAAQINAGDHPYNVVPARFDPEAELDWTPVWSLTRECHRYLPTSMLYYGMSAEPRTPSEFVADSNGCAAGNTMEEAILQGFFELVERDAFAIWWYNRLYLPGVDLNSFGDEYLAAAGDYYRGLQRELWVLDATGDLGIPVFVAISRRTDKKEEDIIYGAGAHTDPHIAALRAVCELNQFLNWVQGSGRGGAGYQVDDPQCLWWWRNGTLEKHPWLVPVADTPSRTGADHPVHETADARDDLEWCRALVEARGMEFLVLDQTRPDIGMPVARVIVPGMRHYWERFAPGRLYDV
ncbi:MAG: TOMM precursor leader peptide-binding protein, partial [Alphaproteobacteria bacterium]|nr:TOMM precursor leader peptide-binding protein [Alphaproteobacteria bacterium]